MKIQFNWGTGIAIALIVMICGMLTLFYIATRQDYFLVEKDYYQKGINYQEQIDRINNVNALREKPTVTVSNSELLVTLPNWFANKTIKGEIQLYSPVDEAFDKTQPLNLSDQLMQSVSLNNIKPGRYTVKLDWTANQTAYYWEQKITIE